MLSSDSLFLESIKDLLIIISQDYKVLFLNTCGAEVYGTTKEKALNRICYEVFKQRDKRCRRCPIEKVLKTGKSYFHEQSEIIPGGSRVYGEVRSYPVLNDGNDMIAVLTIAIDITGKKKMAQKYTTFLSNKILESRSDSISEKQPSGVYAPLSKRETEVLRLIAEGYSNPEISYMLSISLNTVKTHVTGIFNKLGINDRTLAAVKASNLDLI